MRKFHQKCDKIPWSESDAARESSLDTHGELVAPHVAFDFIRTMLYETEDERYESLKLAEIAEPTLPFLVGYFGMV